jgi:hypothetical protein
MRTLLTMLLAASVATASSAQEVVIFDSVNEGFRPAVDAASFLGFTVNAYESGQEAEWTAAVADGADIVVFDVNSNFTEPQLVSFQLDAIEDYLNANPNGKAIVALWFMGSEAGHPLWPLMDIAYCSDFNEPPPLNNWAPGHPIWAGLPDPLINSGPYFVDGAKVSVGGDGLAIGGFSADPATCEAGLVLSGDCRTLYIGLTGRGGDLDSDTDGVADWNELYRNAYPHLLADCGGATPIVPSSWGRIKVEFGE